MKVSQVLIIVRSFTGQPSIAEGDGNMGFQSHNNIRNVKYSSAIPSVTPFMASDEMADVKQVLSEVEKAASVPPASAPVISSQDPSTDSSCVDRNFAATSRQSKNVSESGIWALTDDYGFLRVILNIKVGETNGKKFISTLLTLSLWFLYFYQLEFSS